MNLITFKGLPYHDQEAIRASRGVSVVQLHDGSFAVFAHGRPTESVRFVEAYDSTELLEAVLGVYTWMLRALEPPKAQSGVGRSLAGLRPNPGPLSGTGDPTKLGL